MDTSSTLESSTPGTSHTIEAGTKCVFQARKRLYALTLEKDAYTHWSDIYKYMTSRKKPIYALVCHHDGPNFPHYHCLFQYDNPKVISSKNLFGAHIEEHVWSPQKYVDYCKGLDEKHKSLEINCRVVIESGELKQQGGSRVKDLKSADIDELDWRMYHTATKIQEKERSKQGFFDMLDEIESDSLQAPLIIYITGMSGHGKTYNAYKLALKLFKKDEIGRISFNNNFATVDNPEGKCFVIEEFRPSQLAAADFLQFTDKYGYHVNIKGGSVYLRPQSIIICSIFDVNDIYKDEINVQFQRRVSCIYQADEHALIPCIDEPDILKNINDPALIRRGD